MEEESENTVSSTFWRVVRMDTNGVTYEEAKNLDEEEAREMARRRDAEIGSHHQTIWAEEMEPQ